MTLIGIDPGWGGGIATLSPEGAIATFNMPKTELEVWEFFRPLRGKAEAFMELVHAMPVNGCVPNFKLGGNRGALVTAMRALDIDFTEVSPVAWMKRLQPLPKGAGDQRTKRKRRIKEMMAERYPKLKLTLKTADAVAILDYAIDLKRT